MRRDRKINKENIVVWQWHETPKLMLVCKSASCQKSFGWYSSCFVDFFLVCLFACFAFRRNKFHFVCSARHSRWISHRSSVMVVSNRDWLYFRYNKRNTVVQEHYSAVSMMPDKNNNTLEVLLYTLIDIRGVVYRSYNSAFYAYLLVTVLLSVC